ncbi:hypothetical protein PT974_12144 [Cladobotryum mycophilum]|uniref:Fungal STAND N-terminal Goodbye domain-containing protein n=1 Tax=Cladobotryum mycophilum TaxID=491253 RepID=A0ABR0S766_9HYPO
MAEMSNPELPLRVSFIKFEAPRLHRAFSVPADYDSRSDKFIAPRERRQPEIELQVDLKDLQAAINEFQKSFTDSSLTLNTETCTWEDVFNRLEETTVRYKTVDESGMGYLRKLWRKTGENADNIDPWLDFIPDEYGLNFVRAGIVVILQLAKRSVEHRERVHEAIEQVVDAVTRASPKRRIFNWDNSLKDYIQKLYVAVLEAVSVIIQYLLQNIQKIEKPYISTKEFLSAAVIGAALNRARGKEQIAKKPKPVKRSLHHIDHMVNNVKFHATEFAAWYSNLRDEILVDGYSLHLESQTRLRHLDADTKCSIIISTQMKETVDSYLPAIEGKTTSIENKLVQLDDSVKTYNEESRAQHEKFREWMKDELGRELMNFTSEFLRNSDQRWGKLAASFASEISRSRTPIPKPAPLVSSRVLLDLLRVPISAPNKDLDIVMMEKTWFKEQTLLVAEELFQTPLFHQWFASEYSSLFLADGYDEEHATATISSMSIVCLSLIGSIISARREREVVAYFFCGLHCDQTDGPKLMMRSLIMQLLLALQARRLLDLSFIDKEVYLQDLQHAKPQALVFTLQGLVQLFPADMTVYCLVDGVQWFDGGYPGFFKQDMLYFVSKIRELARPQLYGHYHGLVGDHSVRCRLKVLLTSANGTDSCWERVIGPAERVSLGSTF